MIDTIGLYSPAISDAAADLVNDWPDTIERTGLRTSTGEVEYSITKSELRGSYDHRFSVRVTEQFAGSPVSVGTAAPRMLQVEGSIHKAILGHNVYGGPSTLLAGAQWLVGSLERRLGVELPPAGSWLVHRLDYAEAFDLGTSEACQEFFLSVQGGKYRRRVATIYTGQSIAWNGKVSGFKLYHKGPEFAKHDRTRFLRVLDSLEIAALQRQADGLVRCEVSARRKLKDDFGTWPRVDQVGDSYMSALYDREVAAFLGQSQSSIETVRTHKAVSRRLVEVYGSVRGNHLFGTWLQLAALGDAECRKSLARPTYYRHRKLLKDAAVTWIGADVQIVERLSLVPGDFSLRRSDRRRLTGEAPEVAAALALYRQAS
jgi:II/X family phage/plasmid replication protein